MSDMSATSATIQLTIDGRAVTAAGDATLLEAATGAGIPIPTLCHHEGLEPFGGCRLCMVEARSGGESGGDGGDGARPARLLAACVHHVEPGLQIRTRSGRIDRIRKGLLELFLAHAPHSPKLSELAAEYGADADRFGKEASFCVHCGLCVRYCAEVRKAHAVGFIDRGIKKEICFLPETAAAECDGCKECFPLCPTSYLQAAYVLTAALAFGKSGARD